MIVPRKADMPPWLASMIYLKCMPIDTRFSDYNRYVAKYRRQRMRSVLWANIWAWGEAGSNAWRVLPDKAKHTALAVLYAWMSRDD